MKSRISIFSLLLVFAFAWAGCEKHADRIADFTVVDATQNAFVKINYASAYQANQAVQLKINDVRVSNTINYSYPFPGGGLNTNGASDPLYFPIAAGNTKISVVVPARNTTTDSLQLFTGTIATQAGKYYTYNIVDTGANAQPVVVEDDPSIVPAGFGRFRFTNLMPNQPALDLYYGTTVVAANIAYKATSASFDLPTTTTAATFTIRPAGAAATTTALATYPATGTYGIPNSRSLTVFARGYSSITSTSDPRRGQLSLFFVR